MLCVLVFYVVLNKPKHFIMKTPIQDLITQVEEWMLYDKYVQDNPLDYEEYILNHANQMIEVKGKFIEMCKAMLEKEREQIIDFTMDYVNSGSIDCLWDGDSAPELDIDTSPEQYYYRTFNTK